METRFEQFLKETIPNQSAREDLQRFLGCSLMRNLPVENCATQIDRSHERAN